MEAITIRIYAASEGGYMYDIYNHDLIEVYEDAGHEPESDDGGHCTTTMQNALAMAARDAADIIKREKGEECPGCWENMKTKGTPRDGHFGDGMLCPECYQREVTEGDFISER